MKLVARFYDPTAGAVSVDGIDLRTIELGAFRRQLGIVPQEAFLFTGTVRDNIAYGRPDASDAEVEAAARAVGAHDFVASLPHGYLEPVSERGRSLSSGQRQLLALARARLVDPAILLLDEATSQLDLASEARVQQAMQAAAAGSHHDPRRPPPAHRRPRRPHPRGRPRSDRRGGHARVAARARRRVRPALVGVHHRVARTRPPVAS